MAVSTDSTILQEEMDETYEPTEEEIMEFASWLGMEFPRDDALLWIAKEGLKAPLPAEWKPCRTQEDEIYYFNFDTGESSWDHPCDDFYRNLYKEEFEKMQLRRPEQSGSPTIPLPPPPSVKGAEEMRGEPDAATEAAGPARAPLVIKWKSAMGTEKGAGEEPEQPVVAEDKVGSREKSMQEEMLEKIKRELQEEGGSLMEQRRREIIEEVERQIEMEKLRLQEKHEQEMQRELRTGQEKLRQREVERRLAWEAKLKQEEEEASRMDESLQARRKKREEEVCAQLEAEARSLRQTSQQRLEAFRMGLKEEEARLMEQGKPEARQLVVEAMKASMVAMLEQVMSSLERSILERELGKAREEAERPAKEARDKVESEVEREVAEFKEQMLKQESSPSRCPWSSSCPHHQQVMEVLLAALVARRHCCCCCSSS